MTDARKPVDRVERLEEELALVRAAQKTYAEFTQEQVDRIFFAAAMAAGKMRLPLAKMAVEETGMGVVEDKVIKNHFASEYIYNAYRDVKTCGVIEEDKAYGITRLAEPLGVIAAVIPTTNPTSTAIFKTLACLKTRNGIIISPPARQEVHGRGRAHRAGGRGGGRRAGAHHLLDRRAQPGDDQPHHVRVRLHVGHGRPGHGALGLLPAASPRWAWARATCPPSSTSADILLAVNSIIHSRPLTTA